MVQCAEQYILEKITLIKYTTNFIANITVHIYTDSKLIKIYINSNSKIKEKGDSKWSKLIKWPI